MCVVVDEAGHLSMVAADKSREAARLVTEAADKNGKISTALLCKAKKRHGCVARVSDRAKNEFNHSLQEFQTSREAAVEAVP